MKALIQILSVLLIWNPQSSIASSNHYGQISPSHREAEAKKSLYYYHKAAISIPRNGPSGTNSKSNPEIQDQTPAQDRIFFPPYVFPFWGLPYGVHSKGGFFNPGLFPFVPGGPGFPPYDGVFGGPAGPGQFPGPSLSPFPRPPPGAVAPTPSVPLAPSESGDNPSSSKRTSSYKSKSAKKYKYRKAPTPVIKSPKKEKQDCDCISLSSDDDYDYDSDNRRASHYKKCKCKDVEEKEKKPIAKVVLKRPKTTRITRYRALPTTKKPCKYGYRSGSNGGCKAPPPPAEDDSVEDGNEDEDYNYQPPPPPKCKKGRCPKDNVEDEDEEEQPNYVPMYVPVPYPVPSSNLYSSDQGQQTGVYSAPQPQPSYYTMDPSKKQQQQQQQMSSQKYSYTVDQSSDMGKQSMQNSYIQQYQNPTSELSDSPLILQYYPTRPQPQQTPSNQGDEQGMSISSGSQGSTLRYPKYGSQQRPDSDPLQASTSSIIYSDQPMPMGFSYGTGNFPSSGNNNGGTIQYIQIPQGNTGPQFREMYKGQDSSSGMSSSPYEVMYAAPTQTQASMFRSDMNPQNQEALMNFGQAHPQQNENVHFNSNVRNYRNAPNHIFEAVVTAPPVFVDNTQSKPMNKRQIYGTIEPSIEHTSRNFHQRSANVDSGSFQNYSTSSSSSSSHSKDNKQLGISNGRSSVVSGNSPVTSMIPSFTISTTIHMHNFTGSESTFQGTGDSNDTRYSENSKVLSTIHFNSDNKTTVAMENGKTVPATRMFVEQTFGNHTVVSKPTLIPIVSG